MVLTMAELKMAPEPHQVRSAEGRTDEVGDRMCHARRHGRREEALLSERFSWWVAHTAALRAVARASRADERGYAWEAWFERRSAIVELGVRMEARRCLRWLRRHPEAEGVPGRVLARVRAACDAAVRCAIAELGPEPTRMPASPWGALVRLADATLPDASWESLA